MKLPMLTYLSDSRLLLELGLQLKYCKRMANNHTIPMNEKKIELLKHKHSIELENTKWQFKKEELSYVEAGQHLRSLNQQLWQVPSMVIAITGGIWYAAASIAAEDPKKLALFFAAIVNILTIPIIIRLRILITKYIKLQLNFLGKKDGKGSHIVITCWTLLLLLAAILSATAALNTDKISSEPKKTEPPKVSIHIKLEQIDALIL